MVEASVRQRLFAEFLGTGALVAAIIGSGIAAQRLSPGDVGAQLLMNAAATGAALVVLILVLQPISGAHLNPVVTLIDQRLSETPLRGRLAAGYIAAQCLGAVAGALLTNHTFGLDLDQLATQSRTGGDLWTSELVATAALVAAIFLLVRSGHTALVAPVVGLLIAAAILATASTAFANPAVTLGRALSDSFAGIAPASVPGFVLAQVIGAAVGAVVVVALTRTTVERASGTETRPSIIQDVRFHSHCQCRERDGDCRERHTAAGCSEPAIWHVDHRLRGPAEVCDACQESAWRDLLLDPLLLPEYWPERNQPVTRSDYPLDPPIAASLRVRPDHPRRSS